MLLLRSVLNLDKSGITYFQSRKNFYRKERSVLRGTAQRKSGFTAKESNKVLVDRELTTQGCDRDFLIEHIVYLVIPSDPLAAGRKKSLQLSTA